MIRDNPFYVNPYLEIEDKFAKEKLILCDFNDISFFEKVKQVEVDAKVTKVNHDGKIRSHSNQYSTPRIHVESRTSGQPTIVPLVAYSKSEQIGEAQVLEESGEHVLVEQEVDQDLPTEVDDALNIVVPSSRVVKLVYDEDEDDDAIIQSYVEFMCDDTFIKSKEFREFVIHVKSVTDIKRRIEEVRDKVEPSLQEEVEK